MKKLIPVFCAFGLFAPSAFSAEAKVIKTCNTTIAALDEGVDIPAVFEIIANGTELKGKVTQQMGNEKIELVERAEILEESVRENVMKVEEGSDLNTAEKLMYHAHMLTSDPTFKGKFSAGLDLNAVRSATVYLIGGKADMGMTAIVDAKDSSGKLLGSFLGGFVVSPCK